MGERPSEDTKALLFLFYTENARQARHYEDHRQSLSNAVAVATGLVLAGLLAGRGMAVGPAAYLLAGVFLAVLGTFGFLASLRSHERSRLHVERLHAVRDEIGRQFPTDISHIYEVAREKHARRYPKLSERTARVHYLWQGLHASVALLGSLLALAGLLGLATGVA